MKEVSVRKRRTFVVEDTYFVEITRLHVESKTNVPHSPYL
jgi:hypothetical protein